MKSKTGGPLKIYLDQNKWIELGREYYGRSNSPSLNNALLIILKSVKLGIAVYPFSEIHVIETQYSGNKARARRLINFIVDLSNGVSMAPVTALTQIELKNEVAKYLGSTQNLNPIHAFGNGVLFAFGRDWQSLVQDLNTSETVAKLVDSYINTPQGTKSYLGNVVSSPTPQRLKNQARTLAHTIETKRRIEWAPYNKEVRRRARFVLELMTVNESYGIPNFFMSEKFDLESRMSVLENTPTLNVMGIFATERDENLTRKPDANDLGDVAALAVAVPYCDIVVTEKHWANVAKRHNLDKKYETRILTDVRDLVPLLLSSSILN